MNILVTNFSFTNEDVCVINTTLTPAELETALKRKVKHFDEVYAIPDDELQYYIYDPLFADEQFDNNVRNTLHQRRPACQG